MVKEVKYNGYTAQPNEYQSADGDLAVCMNLVPEDGGLKGIKDGKEILELPEGATLWHIHENAGMYTNYIIEQDGKLYWRAEGEDNYTNFDVSPSSAIIKILTIGNVLLAMANDGVFYYLAKVEASGIRYNYIGDRIPPLNAKVALSTRVADTTQLYADFGDKIENQTEGEISGTDRLGYEQTQALRLGEKESILLFGSVRQQVYERVFSVINTFSQIINKEGYFLYPFYLRLAYRLYDGTHVCHTPPILLVPTTWGQPLATVRIGVNNVAYFDPIFSLSSVHLKFTPTSKLDDWKDLIQGIDMFVSKPLVDLSDSPESLMRITTLPFFKYNTDTTEWEYTEKQSPLMMTLDNPWHEVNPSSYRSIFDEMRDIGLTRKYRIEPRTWPAGKYIVTSPGGMGRIDYFWVNVAPYTESEWTSMLTYADTGTMVPFLDPEDNDERIQLLPGANEGAHYIGYMRDNIAGRSIIYKETLTEVYAVIKQQSTQNLDFLHHYLQMERADGKLFKEEISQCSNFYQVANIDINELLSHHIFDRKIEVEPQSLLYLTSRPTLSDTGKSRNKIVPDDANVYNNRINFIINKELIDGMSCGLDKLCPSKALDRTYDLDGTQNWVATKAMIEIEENSQLIYVDIDPFYNFIPEFKLSDLNYYSFPRGTAKALYVKFSSTNSDNHKTIKIPLEKHDFLDAAFAFNDFNILKYEEVDLDLEKVLLESSNELISQNQIWGSSVSNPFHFEESNMSILPVEKIYQLSSLTEAISEGQFGQYPLFAFTNEGLWAIGISDTGTFTSQQPFSRDILLSNSSVLQLDNAILFATERGVMSTTGQDTTCISDVIDNIEPFKLAEIPGGKALMKLTGVKEGAFNIVPFKEFLKGIRMAYDYTHQRVLLFNDAHDYAYVYSLKSKEWGMCESNFMYPINSYPEALVVTKDNKLVNLSEASGETRPGLIMTRALKLDDGDVMKTVNTIIQRGYFDRGDVTTVLWGSRDLKNWHIVWSSKDHYLRGFRGTPYKYFRIGATTTLTEDEQLIGASIMLEPKQTNKLR